MSHANSATKSVRYLHEMLFSGALASAFLTGLLHSSIYWSGQFFGWGMGLNSTFHRRLNAAFGIGFAFYLWSLALAFAVFFLLRVCSWVSLPTKVFRDIVGVMVVAAPTICLWFVEYYQPGHPYEGSAWFRFEGCAAVGIVLLYAHNRWPVPVWITVILLTLHSALWIHAYLVKFEYLGFWLLTAPITACLSTAIWGYYVKRYAQQQSDGARSCR